MTTIQVKGMRMSQIEKNIVSRIAGGWSREKDSAQPRGLEFDIQHECGCSFGKALTIANAIRLTWPV